VGRRKAEIITNHSPRSTAFAVTSTRREFLLIKVEGDQLSRWLSTNIRGNRQFNGLCTYHSYFLYPAQTDKQERVLINLGTFKARDKETFGSFVN